MTEIVLFKIGLILFLIGMMRKRKTSYLYCGLFGFNGDSKIMDDVRIKMIQAKIKILGMYNIERGKHSCGVYINDALMKGVNEEKLFSDFIQSNAFPINIDSDNYNIIGHTRQATHGEHIESNAHPFLVDDLVLAHNGVISNIWSLCNKNKIDHSLIRVDSLALAHLINKEGFKILNNYEGFAALIMAKPSEPNSLYMYRGSSKRASDGEEIEERPLFYMQSEEGIYISSLQKSLLAISDSSNDKIKQVEGNIVHKLTNGRMTKSKFYVDRGSNNISFTNYHSNNPKTTGTGKTEREATTTTTGTNSSIRTPSSLAKDFEKPMISMIWHETLPVRVDSYKDCAGIIFHMGRYWVVDNEEIRIAHNSYYINKRGRINSVRTKDSHNYFFYEGVMMKDEKSFREATNDMSLQNPCYNFAMFVSRYSEFPVCNSRSDIENRSKSVSSYVKHRWYHNQVMLSNYGFTPKFSDRNYIIKEGLLNSISAQQLNLPGLKDEPYIDLESLEKERKELDEKRTSGIVVKMPKKDEPKDIKMYSHDLSNFYRTWDSVEQAHLHFSVIETIAIRRYICDVMKNEMEITPETIYDDTVDIQLDMFLAVAIESNSSLMDVWDEVNYDRISHYIDLAETSPLGELIKNQQNAEEKIVEEDSCQCPPKPENMKLLNPPINLQNVNDVFPPDEDKKNYEEEEDKELFPPVDDESEELFQEEENGDKIDRDYAFQDGVDSLLIMQESADTLFNSQEDDFAQESAALFYKTVHPLVVKLKSLCKQYGEKKLERHLEDTFKPKARV